MGPSDMMRHPDDWVGEMLHGKWRLDELLGVGGVASVYAATDRHGRRVAVKLMHAHWAEEPTVRERFLREGYAANRVKHPAVISAFADGVTDDGIPFLVLELMEGRSLETELMVNGTLDVEDVLDIADQVLDALGAAHELGILHRDLKPDNLLVLHDRTIRVLDFGIARMRSRAPEDPKLTINGRAMGTPGFMSPEQARGDWDQVDERTDVWSVGATMFALLTGREVHECEMQHQALVAAMTQPAPPIREVEPSVPERVAVIIDRALAFRPEDRWGTAAEMQRNVQHAMALLQPTTTHDEAPPTLRPVSTNPHIEPAQPVRDRTRGWRAGIVAAAVIAAVAALGARHRDDVDALKQQVAATWRTPAPVVSSMTEIAAELAEAGAAAALEIEIVAVAPTASETETSESESEPPATGVVIDLDLPDP